MRGDHSRVWPNAVRLTLLLALAPATPCWAQTVRGTVVDDETGASFGAVEVAVLATNDSIVARHETDERGRFRARMPDGGSYRLRAGRIGYESATSDNFVLDAGQTVLAELRLQLSPVMLDPLEAIVEGQSLALARVGFYQREQMGFGQVRTPEDLESRPPLDVSDLLRGMSGVRVVRRSSGSYDVFSNRAVQCRPSISIDGQVVQIGSREGSSRQVRPVDPSGLEAVVGSRDLERSGWQDIVNVVEVGAIEVISGAAGLPDWASGYISPCGAILIWTKGYLTR